MIVIKRKTVSHNVQRMHHERTGGVGDLSKLRVEPFDAGTSPTSRTVSTTMPLGMTRLVTSTKRAFGVA